MSIKLSLQKVKEYNNEREKKSYPFIIFHERSTLACNKTEIAPAMTQEQQLGLFLHFESSSYIAE